MNRSEKWIFSWIAAYIILGGINAFWLKVASIELVQVCFIIGLSLPVFIPPLARLLKMSTIWEILSPKKD